MIRLRWLLVSAVLLSTSTAWASERLVELGLTGVLYAINRDAPAVLIYASGMTVAQGLEGGRVDVRQRGRESRHGSDHEGPCRAALAKSLSGLQDQARAAGYDVVVNLTSAWRDQPSSAAGVYTCAVGQTAVSVDLKGSAFRIKKVRAQQGSEAPVASVVQTTKSEAGVVYSVLLGSSSVGAKLQASPDQDREHVQVALAFRAEGDASPHQGCALGVLAGSEGLVVEAARYTHAKSQETLFGQLTLAQLDQLAAQDGALTACDTRVDITSASRAKIRTFLEAVRKHLASKKPVQRGDALSL